MEATATQTAKGLTVTDPTGRTVELNGKGPLAAAAVTFSQAQDGSWVLSVNRTLAAAGKAHRGGTGRVIVVEVAG